MLSKFLSLKRILIDARANSLEDAILLCGNLLVGDGCATCEYPAAMVKTARQLGDAIVMAPQTALPHASFSEGGLRPAVSVVRLAQPLDFGKANRPVRLLLGFCGSDAGSHMEGTVGPGAVFEHPVRNFFPAVRSYRGGSLPDAIQSNDC